MPKYNERTILINELLVLIDKDDLTAQDLLNKTNVRRLSHRARTYITGSSSGNYVQGIGSALRYMKYNNLIIESRYSILSVTNKAKIRLKAYNIEHIFVTIPKKWDSKWRLVVFEIDNVSINKRNAFVKKLKQVGFKKLQDSVYVIPYRCQYQINQLIDYYHFKNQVFYLEVTKSNNEAVLRKLFPKP